MTWFIGTKKKKKNTSSMQTTRVSASKRVNVANINELASWVIHMTQNLGDSRVTIYFST